MTDSLLSGARFRLERWVQRGVLYQLLFIAALVVGVAFLGGVAAWALTSAFESLGTAVWWSFLRLTDPGYLGDDEGTTLRTISTVVTVLGYVLFMGSLIAIMTQWLSGTIRQLESGLTPISMEGHFVILGWTNRTPEIIKKLLTAGGRLERFFAKRGGVHKLRVVVLASEVNAELHLEVRESLGEDWDDKQVFLRSGSSLQSEHLERLDLLRAAVVMIPGADFEMGGAELTDTRVIKTLLTLGALFKEGDRAQLPLVAAELFDPNKIAIAERSIHSPVEVIASDRMISRLLSQSLRHPGVATVLLQLMTHRDGNALYLRNFPELAGCTPRSLSGAFPKAVVLGAVSGEGSDLCVHLDPTEDYALAADDLLILVSTRFVECVHAGPLARPSKPEPPRRFTEHQASPTRKLLILGWSYKIPALLREINEAREGKFEITIMSRHDLAERQEACAQLELSEAVWVENLMGDYTIEKTFQALNPQGFDHVVFFASGGMSSSEEADARTVLGIVLLRSIFAGQSGPEPEVLAEILDPDNAKILGEVDEAIFVSPQLLSHLLAHVALRPELNEVFEELIGATGAELDLLSIQALGLSQEVSFAEVQTAAANFGCIALGFFKAGLKVPHVELNPARQESWSLGERDRVIVLMSQEVR